MDTIVNGASANFFGNEEDTLRELTDTLDDGTSWAEGYLHNKAYDHLCICYAMHALHTHEPWCLPDILRMDDFTLNVKLNYERSVSEQRDILYPDVNENDPHWPEGVPCLERWKILTFEEIANEWRDANANQDEDELDKRTFHRYRENIQSQFGITVECNKSDGYRYYLKRDPVENDDVTEWMLSFLRLASLGDMLKFHNKVMLDTPPYNTEYLDDILAAIDKQYLLKFKYVSGFGAESDIVLQPAFVRYFKQRWYVVGVKISSAEEDVRKLVRVPT